MNMSREVVTIYAGQAGTQMSTACWELFCLEHGVCPDGFLRMFELYDFYNTFFAITRQGKHTPRSVIVDSEPTVIDQIRIGPYRNLFHPEFLITGKEDAANNFAKGYYTVGREMLDTTLDRIRIMCENCENLSSFIISRSSGGGTGSGFITLLLEHLSEDYAKKLKIGFTIHTAPTTYPVVVEPYNTLLTTHGTLDHENCYFLVDNEALYNICTRKLNVKYPMFTNFNRLHAQIISGITAPIRFRNGTDFNLEKLQTNLIPYPRIHFSLVSYAPFVTPVSTGRRLTNQITLDCFSRENHMAECSPEYGIYMSCCLLYRGEINTFHVLDALALLKNNPRIRYVNWSPVLFKLAINYRPAITIPGGDLKASEQAVVCLSNNTAIQDIWSKLIVSQFEPMYKKRAFVHYYLAEGMEKDAFQDARDNITDLIKEYRELEAP